MTDDQKKALLIGGGISAILLAYLFSRGSPIPTAVDVRPASRFDATDPPGYTTYNVQPVDIPAPGISNAVIPQAMIGQGCCSKTDGCFTSNGIDTGQAPLSLSQLLAGYGAAFPQFLDLVKASQEGYKTPAPNIAELASAASCYSPWADFGLGGAGQRAIKFFSGSQSADGCWRPAVNGY